MLYFNMYNMLFIRVVFRAQVISPYRLTLHLTWYLEACRDDHSWSCKGL